MNRTNLLKTIYIHRSVDLENIAFTDEVHRTKTAAYKSAQVYNKTKGYTDLIIQVDVFDITYEEVKEMLERNNVYQINFSFVLDQKIIYRRWKNY